MYLRHELLLRRVLAAEHETNQLTVKACKGGVRSALTDSFSDRRSLQGFSQLTVRNEIGLAMVYKENYQKWGSLARCF